MKSRWLILWMVSQTAWATPQLRHAKGITSMELVGGKTALCYHLAAAYRMDSTPPWYWKIALGGTWHHSISYRSLQLMPAVGMQLGAINPNVQLNLLAGAAATYESHRTRGSNHEGWNTILHLGPELELFLSHHFALLISLLSSYYCLEHPYRGRWGYEGVAGLKLTF